jgi:hypothetical protein
MIAVNDLTIAQRDLMLNTVDTYFASGPTYTSRAIDWASGMLNTYGAPRKIMILLSDDVPSGASGMSDAFFSSDQAKGYGQEIYTVAYRDPDILGNLWDFMCRVSSDSAGVENWPQCSTLTHYFRKGTGA